MKWITIQLMKRQLKKSKRYQKTLLNNTVKEAYDDLINNYRDTIMFLKAEK